MATEDVAALRAAVLAKELEAQEAQADNHRLKQELGLLRKRALEADALEESLAAANAETDAERAKQKVLQSALDSANTRLLKAEQILAAGKAIADGLTVLSK